MEELLNKLIEKGWKPFDVDVKIKRAKCFHSVHFIVRPLVNFVLDGYAEATVPLRELCAKESGLWQFVCENGMIKENKDKKEERYMYECEYTTGSHSTTNYLKHNIYTKEYFYEYRLIESALKDESELEEFLLNNIKL